MNSMTKLAAMLLFSLGGEPVSRWHAPKLGQGRATIREQRKRDALQALYADTPNTAESRQVRRRHLRIAA